MTLLINQHIVFYQKGVQSIGENRGVWGVGTARLEGVELQVVGEFVGLVDARDHVELEHAAQEGRRVVQKGLRVAAQTLDQRVEGLVVRCEDRVLLVCAPHRT